MTGDDYDITGDSEHYHINIMSYDINWRLVRRNNFKIQAK